MKKDYAHQRKLGMYLPTEEEFILLLESWTPVEHGVREAVSTIGAPHSSAWARRGMTNVPGTHRWALLNNKGRSGSDIAQHTGIDRTYLYRLTTQETDWLNQPLNGGPIRQALHALILRLTFGLE